MLMGRLRVAGALAAALTITQGNAAVCRTVTDQLFNSTAQAVAKYEYLLAECNGDSDVGDASPRSGLPEEQATVQLAKVRSASFAATPVTNSGNSDIHSLRFSPQIQAVSQAYNIDPLLLHAIAHVESRHNPDAISPAGAIGLMQVMPATARRFGLEDAGQLFDPMANLVVSSLYLRVLYQHFGNDLPLVLAAYNAGENAVLRYGRKVPPYGETKNFVRKVMDYYIQLRRS